jgi:hypothetical protein
MELSPELAAELMQKTNGDGEVMLAESDDQSRSMDSIMAEAAEQQQVGGEQEVQQHLDDGLSPKQRADIKWQLMKEGIKQWFSQNWPLLLAGLIAAGAVIIAAIVASGGAVLAALPMILNVLAIVFAAEAIAKITGHLRDYMTKGWAGDIQGGGKSLAKALAAGAIELALLLTFEAGKVAVKGAKAIAKGVKTVAKGAGKVATKAFRGIIKGVKYIIEKGKVLFKGIAGTGVGKQFNKLQDFGKALLERMRFRAFRIRVANRRFRLEGLINPWVIIAEGNIKTEITDAGGSVKPVTRETKGATFVTDDELEAVKKGGTPLSDEKSVDITEFETVPYKTSTTSGRGVKGDDLTGDHIPSNAALVKAQETKLGRRLTSREKNQIKNKGVTVVLTEGNHKDLSRTFGGRNTKTQIAGDAADLGKAFSQDAEAIFQGLIVKKELNPEIVGSYMRAYRENVKKGVFGDNAETDEMFMKYLKMAKSNSDEAFRNETKAVLDQLHKDKKLTPEIVNKYKFEYTEDVRMGEFKYSKETEEMFNDYFKKSKTHPHDSDSGMKLRSGKRIKTEA